MSTNLSCQSRSALSHSPSCAFVKWAVEALHDIHMRGKQPSDSSRDQLEAKENVRL